MTMFRRLTTTATALVIGVGVAKTAPAQEIVVDRDNTAITTSGRVVIARDVIADADGNGVLHVTGSNLVLDFNGAVLRGAGAETTPDSFSGIGIRITGSNVTIRNARIEGFKGGIVATGAHGLVIEDVDVSDNFAQRLRSTPEAEAGSDWLWPHANDRNEWLTNYGAGIYVEESNDVVIRRVRARRTQNGIILDTVNDSKIYDNDCSFLSGWGLAMWRSSRNVISRNAFDFCVRGYSHGVYNRGQDSAGILMFEQNNENVLAENSATHGGDGFFGFGGRDALGEHWLNAERDRLKRETGRDNVDALIRIPVEVIERSRRRGNNDNLLIDNDFSYAPAHGIEMTFSFGNRYIGNRLIGNAICGIWGGYSQESLIAGNVFAENGDMAYGLERGGVNIEHGVNNRIVGNTFRGNRAGVHLWWDADDGLMNLPWAKANHPGGFQPDEDGRVAMSTRAARTLPSVNNTIDGNTFDGDAVVLHLRDADRTIFSRNAVREAGRMIETVNSTLIDDPRVNTAWERPEHPVHGETTPIGKRSHLAGREHIIITEWGPYDWESPYLQRMEATDAARAYRLLGNAAVRTARVEGPFTLERDEHQGFPVMRLRPARGNAAARYTLVVETDEHTLRREGLMIATTWSISVFPWKSDPRENLEAWHAEAKENAVTFTRPSLNLAYGMGGPGALAEAPGHVTAAALPNDRFGTIAATKVHVPAGRWRLHTLSDDGIRVWLNGEMVIDDWTWHAPRRHEHEFTLAEEAEIELRVDHFELDGYAVLQLDLEPVNTSD